MESRFAPFLSTNYVPSKNELNETCELLMESDNQLSQLNAEITRLQSKIDKLISKRDQLHTDIVRHRNLIAPLRRVPDELLQEIFFHCLPVDHNPVMSCHEAPLLLGRVCSHWRSTILSAPRLWSSIHIVVPNYIPALPEDWSSPETRNQSRDFCEAVEAWLSRSGDLPLSISLLQVPYSNSSPGFVEQLISTVIRFSFRWRNVSLIVPFAIDSQLFSVSHEALPLLETFFSDTKFGPTPLPDFTPLDIFRAPHIRAISSHCLKMIPEDVDWSRLTFLSLESSGHVDGILTPSKALGILRKTPNLVHCELDFMGGWAIPSPFDDCQVGFFSLKPFYERLRLPVLISLEFTPSSTRQYPDINISERPSICTLLSRLDSLKELTLLPTLDLTHILFMSLLECSPSITRLSVINTLTINPPPIGEVWSPFTNEIAVLLTPTVGRLAVCPLLEVLECNPCGISDAALLALIEQRTIHALANDVQPLERVDVAMYRQKMIDVPNALPPGVLEGTTITLQYLTTLALRMDITPLAGLKKPNRLQLPTKMYKYFSFRKSV
ncbi:hypothetical protein BDZ94DRAFT_1261656 [Collybia nuda]|uniref:F-box domain-containing protein n=1 Tax=Collybia nuda TaxID=64659 RepID=A0A9P5Y2Q5_9AGAR|nr:hypothetical protein BDZ94DRAFT_1261656 [Collybia nuda]